MKPINRVVAIMVFLFLLIGGLLFFFRNPYTNVDLLYKGTSELWTAEYSVKGKARWVTEDGSPKYDSYQKKHIIVTYNGDLSELTNIKAVYIKFSGGGGFGQTFADDQLRKKSFEYLYEAHGEGFPAVSVIYATVSLDGNEQTLELKRVIE